MALEDSLKELPHMQASARDIAKGYELFDLQTGEIKHLEFTVLCQLANGDYFVVPPEYEAQIDQQLR